MLWCNVSSDSTSRRVARSLGKPTIHWRSFFLQEKDNGVQGGPTPATTLKTLQAKLICGFMTMDAKVKSLFKQLFWSNKTRDINKGVIFLKIFIDAIIERVESMPGAENMTHQKKMRKVARREKMISRYNDHMYLPPCRDEFFDVESTTTAEFTTWTWPTSTTKQESTTTITKYGY